MKGVLDFKSAACHAGAVTACIQSLESYLRSSFSLAAHTGTI